MIISNTPLSRLPNQGAVFLLVQKESVETCLPYFNFADEKAEHAFL
jgi:hypothetical protein